MTTRLLNMKGITCFFDMDLYPIWMIITIESVSCSFSNRRYVKQRIRISQAYTVAHLPLSTADNFLYFVAIVASGIAWVCFGEVPTLLALIGGAFVLAGAILVNAWRQKSSTSRLYQDNPPLLRKAC